MRYIKLMKSTNTGKDQIISLSGRFSVSRCISEAMEFSAKYVAFQILEGTTLLEAKPISEVIKFNEVTIF